MWVQTQHLCPSCTQAPVICSERHTIVQNTATAGNNVKQIPDLHTGGLSECLQPPSASHSYVRRYLPAAPAQPLNPLFLTFVPVFEILTYNIAMHVLCTPPILQPYCPCCCNGREVKHVFTFTSACRILCFSFDVPHPAPHLSQTRTTPGTFFTRPSRGWFLKCLK